MITRVSEYEARMFVKTTSVIRLGRIVSGRVEILLDKGKEGWMPCDPEFKDEGQFDHCRHVTELPINGGSDFCVAKFGEDKKGVGIVVNKHTKQFDRSQSLFYWLEPI